MKVYAISDLHLSLTCDKPMNILMFELPKYENIKKMVITKELLDNPNKELEKIIKENQK